MSYMPLDQMKRQMICIFIIWGAVSQKGIRPGESLVRTKSGTQISCVLQKGKNYVKTKIGIKSMPAQR